MSMERSVRRMTLVGLLGGSILAGVAAVGGLILCGGLRPQQSLPPIPEVVAETPRPEDRDAIATGGGGPSFTDIGREAGLTVPHFNGADGQFRLMETMGSGVGLIDFDGD